MDKIKIKESEIQIEILDQFESICDKAFEQINDETTDTHQIIQHLQEGNMQIFLTQISTLLENLMKNKQKNYEEQKEGQEIGEQNYENLEKVLQKYEAEIREHVRLEQQLKIYAESLEDKLNAMKAQTNNKHQVQDLLKENKMLVQKNNDILKKHQQLQKKIKNEYLTKNISFQNKRNQSLESVIQKECIYNKQKYIKKIIRCLLQLFQWNALEKIFKQMKIKTINGKQLILKITFKFKKKFLEFKIEFEIWI